MNKEEQDKLVKECCKDLVDIGWYTCESFPSIELNPNLGQARKKKTKELYHPHINPNGDLALYLGIKDENGEWKSYQPTIKTLIGEQFLLKRKLSCKKEFIFVNNHDKIPRLRDLQLKVRTGAKTFKRKYVIEDKKDSDYVKVLLFAGDKRKFFWIRRNNNPEVMEMKILNAKENLLNQVLAEEGLIYNEFK